MLIILDDYHFTMSDKCNAPSEDEVHYPTLYSQICTLDLAIGRRQSLIAEHSTSTRI